MSWLDRIFLPQSEVDRGLELDAKNRALTQKKYEAGLLSAGQRDLADKHYDETSALLYDGQISESFDEGLAQGYQNVTGAIKTTLAAPFKFTWASIPWQLWLAGGLALVWYMGGFRRLKGVLT